MEKNVGILILAAGASRRLGKAKQLLTFNDSTLLEHTVEVAKLCSEKVLVVLGARAESLRPLLVNVDFATNEHWEKGMGNSLAFGISEIQKSGIEACLVLQCDQPHIGPALLKEIIALAHESAKGIIASDYGIGSGPPCYFSKKYFPELAILKGDNGAKKLVQENRDDLAFVSFEKGRIDIDTEGDIDKYLS